MLVTTNESRTRLYNMDDFSLVCRYRGAANSTLQIGATCSEDGRHILCGSEDKTVVLWRLKNDLVKTFLGGQGRHGMCDTYEMFYASSGIVTATCFGPEHFNRARRLKSHQELSSPMVTGKSFSESIDEKGKKIDSPSAFGNSESFFQVEDDIGLGEGTLIFAAGFDGIVGVFELK